MREFRIYISVNRFGKMTVHQKEQLRILIATLTDRRINTYWIVDDVCIRGLQIINILSAVHSVSKKKGIIIHIELCSSDKTTTISARMIMKHTPVMLYTNERDDEKDYISLKCLNHPEGCMFNSCLGNTLYIKQDATLSICPRTENICLNQLGDGDSINYVFDTDDFRTLLRRQIEKRSICKENCRIFSLCHGGCPAQESNSACTVQKKIKELSIPENVLREQSMKKLADLYRG